MPRRFEFSTAHGGLGRPEIGNRPSEIDKLPEWNHYQKAAERFHENRKWTSGENLVEHDLNEGLLALANGIQTDLAEIKASLKSIFDELKKRPAAG